MHTDVKDVKRGIVIRPGTVFGNVFTPAKYEFKDSETCPLGRDKCSFCGDFATLCSRGTSDGVRALCICNRNRRLCADDVVDFADAVKNFCGQSTLETILDELRGRGR